MRFFLLIILFASINAQSIITGRVTDSRTGNPLVGVNIFFSRTTYGSTTDNNGFYTLDDIPPGRYELLVSMIGYKLVKESFQIDTDIKIDRDYKLISQPIRMKEIVVSAKSNREWKKNYRRFKSAFLGMSWNAEDCRIMNDYVLSFNNNEHVLEAFASEPIIIENKALGYRVFIPWNISAMIKELFVIPVILFLKKWSQNLLVNHVNGKRTEIWLIVDHFGIFFTH